MKRKKILLVAPPDSIHTKRWVENLRQRGMYVKVASRAQKGICDHFLGREGKTDSENLEFIPSGLGKLLKRRKFDIVHAHFATIYGQTLAAVPTSIKKILSVWGEDVLDEAEKDMTARRRLILGLKKADSITTTSAHLAKFLHKKYCVPRSRIKKIIWGYNQKIYKSLEKSIVERGLKQLGLNKNLEFVVSARICRPQNNIENIIKAYLQSQVQEKLLVLTGKIADIEYVNRLKEKYGKLTNVIFLAPISEKQLSYVYNRAKVTITVPNVDQLCNTIFESLACGTPIIGTNLPVYRERIISEKNGWLIKPNNKKALVSSIKFACQKFNKLEHKKQIITTVAKDTWDVSVQKMLDLYST